MGTESLKRLFFSYIVDKLRARCGYQIPPMGPLLFRAIYSLAPRTADVEIFRNIFISADFSDNTFKSTYWQGKRFEGYATNRILSWLQSTSDSAFFDIGANYGFFSLYVHCHSPSTTIFPFEPNPLSFRRILDARERNSLLRLYPQAIGLSDQTTKLLLHHGSGDLGHSTFGEHPELLHTARTSVDVMPFDDWIKRPHICSLTSNRLWVAKIDVEGFEVQVLNGMRDSLKHRRFRGIMVEINPYTLNFSGSKPDHIYDILTNSGYKPLVKDCVTGICGNQYFEPQD